MGLPGSGKTTIAQELASKLGAQCFNADQIRSQHNDWDFSPEGRIRQAERMRKLADLSSAYYVIVDMVCPLEEMRTIVNPDFVVWVDTIKKGRYEDTNRMFQPPAKYHYRVPQKNYQFQSEVIKLLLENKSAVDLCR